MSANNENFISQNAGDAGEPERFANWGAIADGLPAVEANPDDERWMPAETRNALLRATGANPADFSEPVPLPELPRNNYGDAVYSPQYGEFAERLMVSGMSDQNKIRYAAMRSGAMSSEVGRVAREGYIAKTAKDIDDLTYPEGNVEKIAQGLSSGSAWVSRDDMAELDKTPEGKKRLEDIWTKHQAQQVQYSNSLEYQMYQAQAIATDSAVLAADFRRMSEDLYGGKARAALNLVKDFGASAMGQLATGTLSAADAIIRRRDVLDKAFAGGEGMSWLRNKVFGEENLQSFSTALRGQIEQSKEFYTRPEARTGSFLYDKGLSKIAQTLGSVGASITTFAINPALGWANMYGAGREEIYDKAKSAGLDESTSNLVADLGGIVSAALERLGAERIVEGWKVAGPVGRVFQQSVAAPFVGEGVTETAQSLTGSAAVEIGLASQPGYEFSLDRVGGYLREAAEEGIYGALTGAVAGAGGSNPVQTTVKHLDYRNFQKFIDGGVERFKRAPDINKNTEAMKRLADDTIAKTGAPESGYIGHEEFVNYFQGDMKRMRDAMVDLDVTQRQLDAAKEAGAQIEVPTSNLIRYTAKSEQNADFKQWVRPEPDAPTIQMIQQETLLEAEAAAEYDAIQKENKELPNPFRVFRDQIIEAGHDAEGAQHTTDLLYAMSRSLGKMLNLTPEQVLDLAPIKVSLANNFDRLKQYRDLAERIRTGAEPAAEAVVPGSESPLAPAIAAQPAVDNQAWTQEALNTILQQSGIQPDQAQAFSQYAQAALQSGDVFDAEALARNFETANIFAEGFEQAAQGIERILSNPGAITQDVFNLAGVEAETPQTGMVALQERAADLGRKAAEYRNFYKNPQRAAGIQKITQNAMDENPRGNVVFTPDVDIVRLFSGKQDRSTINHELFHIYNKRFTELAKTENAPAQLVADFATLNEAVGGGLDSSDIDIRRGAEEKAAGMFEKYLSEGNAPSPGLANAFRRFRTWLANIYRNVKEFADIELNPEVRGVFDRMLATEEEIGQARGFYHDIETLAPPTGSTPEQAAAISERSEKARMSTEERQHAKILKEFIGGAEGRKAIRKQAREEVENSKTYSAARDLRNMGGMSYEDIANEIGDAEAKRLQTNHPRIIREDFAERKDNTPRLESLAKEHGFESYQKLMEAAAKLDVGPHLMQRIANLGGMDEMYVARTFGQEAAAKLRTEFGDRIFRREGGMVGAILVAEESGYASVQNMLADISAAPKIADAMTAAVERRVAEADAFVRAAVRQDSATPVDEAYHNDDLSRAMAAKQAVLNEQAKTQAEADGRRTHRQLSNMALQRIAENIVSDTPGNKAGRYFTTVAAYRKRAEAAALADASGDKIAAAKEYQQVRLNHYLIKEMIRAKKDVEDFAKRNTRVNNWILRLEGSGQHKVPPVIEGFRNAIKDMLTTWKVVQSARLAPDVEHMPGKQLGPTIAIPGPVDPEVSAMAPSLAEYIPEWILSRQGADKIASWKDLTVGQIRELGDALDAMTKKGRGEMRALRQPGIETIGQAIADSIRRMSSRKARPDRYGRGTEQDSRGDKARNWFDNFLVKGIVPEYLLAMADGNTNITGEGVGPLQNIAHRFRDGETAKNTMFVQDNEAIKPAIRVLKAFTKRFKNIDRTALGPVPEGLRQTYGFNLEWDGEMAVMVALNCGTANNVKAITGGYGMSQEQINGILSTFTDAELDAVQQILDVMGSHFEETDAVHYQLYNKHIAKEPATPIRVQRTDGTVKELRGGYFPLVYDGMVDRTMGAVQDYEVNLNRGSMNAVRGKPRVQKGHTIERTGTEKPPLLKMDVIASNLNKQARFIQLAEAVHEANAITNDRAWTDMFASRFGDAQYRRVREYIKYVADPDAHNLGQNDVARRTLNWLRGKATTAALGFRVKTGLKQRLDTVPAILHMSLHSRTGASGFKYWLQGVRDIGFTANLGFMNERIKTIYEKSAFMRDTEGNPTADMREQLRLARNDVRSLNIAGMEITKEKALGIAYHFMTTQDRAARSAVWAAAYKMALAGDGDIDVNALQQKGASEAEIDRLAVRFADAAAATFSASTAADITAWQADKGLMNLFTTFLTGTVRRSSRLYQYLDAYRQGQMSVPAFAKAFMMDAAIQAWIPAFLTMAIKQMVGDDDDDEMTVGGIAFDIFFDPLLSIVDGVPLFNMGPSLLRYGRGDVVIPSGLSEFKRRFERTASIGKNIDKGEWDKAAWKGATLFGYVAGVPFENIYREGRGALETIGAVEPEKKRK